MKNCKMCGEPIGSDKRKDSLFCSSTCKGKYHELKKESGNLKTGLKGLGTEVKKSVVPDSDKLEFRGLESTSSFNDLFLNGLKEEAEKKLEEEIEDQALPPQFIKESLSKPNPDYQLAKKKLSECSEYIKRYEQEISRLNKLIEQEKSRNGTGIYAASIGGGATLGYLIGKGTEDVPKRSLKSKKRIELIKKEAQSSITGKSLLWILGGGALGLAVGRFIDGSVKEDREKEKAENIRKIQAQVAAYQKELNEFLSCRNMLKLDLLTLPTTIQEEKEVINPAYLEAMKRQALRNEKKESKKKQGIGKMENMEGEENMEKFKSNPLETDKILSAKNMADKKMDTLGLKGKWLDFFGKPQPNFFLVVHGMSGEGKTHFTIQLAKYLAENHGRVLYVSGEEGFAPTMQQKIKDMGAMVPDLYIGDFRTGEELLAEVPNKYHFIVIDSTNNMDINPELMKAIRQRFKQSGFIAVSQSTKDDKIRGSYQIVHDSDITVKVKDGIAVTTKNRFKAKGTEFNVFAAYRKPDPKIVQLKKNDKLDEGFRNIV